MILFLPVPVFCLYLSVPLPLPLSRSRSLSLTHSFPLTHRHTFLFSLSMYTSYHSDSLQWRHNGRDGVSNHQPHDCLPNVYSGANQRKHQSSASLAFARGIHRWPVNSPHKGPVTRKIFPFDDVIMLSCDRNVYWISLLSFEGNGLFSIPSWLYHSWKNRR